MRSRVSEEKVKIICFVFLAIFFVLGHTLGNLDLKQNYSRNELICTVFYSYVNYSNIAAKVVRKALKPELQADAAKRELVSIKFVKWENGPQMPGQMTPQIAKLRSARATSA